METLWLTLKKRVSPMYLQASCDGQINTVAPFSTISLLLMKCQIK